MRKTRQQHVSRVAGPRVRRGWWRAGGRQQQVSRVARARVEDGFHCCSQPTLPHQLLQQLLPTQLLPAAVLPPHTARSRTATSHSQVTYCHLTQPGHVLPPHTARSRTATSHSQVTYCHLSQAGHVLPPHTARPHTACCLLCCCPDGIFKEAGYYSSTVTRPGAWGGRGLLEQHSHSTRCVWGEGATRAAVTSAATAWRPTPATNWCSPSS